ncbi:MAG: hypothetical protein GAK38_01221 [Xylophilus sp.]|nr:MAG: hypothetical protein GAK38_01221 [Xylophilus sp.]
MASTPAPSCQRPLAVCIGTVSPGTARIAKNGSTRRATSSVTTAMQSSPVPKCRISIG